MRHGTRRPRPAYPRCAPGRPASAAAAWCSSSQMRALRRRACPPGTTCVSLAIFFSASASSAMPAVACSASLENTRCEDAVEQALAQRHRAIDVDDDGDAAPARLGAEIGAEFRAAALGQDGVAVVEQRVGVGQLDLPQFRIAEGDDGALAARVDHDVRDRRHQARHVHEVFGLDAFMRELVENVRGWRFRGRRPSARRSRRGRRAARCRSRH